MSPGAPLLFLLLLVILSVSPSPMPRPISWGSLLRSFQIRSPWTPGHPWETSSSPGLCHVSERTSALTQQAKAQTLVRWLETTPKSLKPANGTATSAPVDRRSSTATTTHKLKPTLYGIKWAMTLWNRGRGYMGVSKNNGTPQIINFNRVFHYKPSILGVFPIFGNTNETPIYIHNIYISFYLLKGSKHNYVHYSGSQQIEWPYKYRNPENDK